MKVDVLLLSPPLAGLIVAREDYMTKIMVSDEALAPPAWVAPGGYGPSATASINSYVYDVKTVWYCGKQYRIAHRGPEPSLTTCIEGIVLFKPSPVYVKGDLF